LTRDFDVYKRVGHRFVAGWLAPEVLDILSVLDSAQRSKDIEGAVAEIGVHHGRLFIGLSLLQTGGAKSVAIDVFGDQDLNIDQSGKGDLAIFRKNVERWSSLNSIVIHQGDSTKVTAGDLRELAGGDIRVFSVDGGHTDSIVFSDMNLAERTLSPGGVVVADDIFNEEWPGVSTGTLRYLNEGGKLIPFAIGFNKVFFALADYSEYYRNILEEKFGSRYLVSAKTSEFAEHEVLIITRVPRRPRRLIGRNQTARKVFFGIQEWRSNRS
jgi:hypothetical protein